MKKILIVALTLGTTVAVSTTTMATGTGVTPEESRQLLVEHFMKKHPDIKFEDFKHGVYNFSADRKAQWETIQEFPPYLDHIDDGQALYEKDLAIFSKCFGDDVTKIRVRYPYFNEETQKVVTLEGAVNKCRTDAGLKPYPWRRGDLAKVTAYLAYKARGKIINVKIESEGARKAFEAGQTFFISPRGQFGLSCVQCHVDNSGKRVRAQMLSPLLGQTTNFPTYRVRWQDVGTIHRRYAGCVRNIRAKSERPKTGELQSVTYSNLEFFQAFMSNGLEIDGPGYRE